MIKIKIKVKNDHRSLTEEFEADELLLSRHNDILQSLCKKVVADFGDPVEECIVKTKMEI